MANPIERRLEALENEHMPADEVFCPLERGESSRDGRKRYEAEHGPQSPKARWVFTSLLIDDEPEPDHDPRDDVRCVHAVIVGAGARNQAKQETP